MDTPDISEILIIIYCHITAVNGNFLFPYRFL